MIQLAVSLFLCNLLLKK